MASPMDAAKSKPDVVKFKLIRQSMHGSHSARLHEAMTFLADPLLTWVCPARSVRDFLNEKTVRYDQNISRNALENTYQ